MTACLQIHISGEATSGSGLQEESSQLALAPQEHPAAAISETAVLPLTTATTGDLGTVSIKNDASSSVQQILSLAAHKYLQTIDPSKPEELNGFVYYLEKVRKVLIVDTKSVESGSLIITVEFSSREILAGLWDDYCTGYLN